MDDYQLVPDELDNDELYQAEVFTDAELKDTGGVEVLLESRDSILNNHLVNSEDVVSLESYYGEEGGLPNPRKYTALKSKQGIDVILPYVSGDKFVAALESSVADRSLDLISKVPKFFGQFVEARKRNVRRLFLSSETNKSAKVLHKLGKLALSLGGDSGSKIPLEDIPKADDDAPSFLSYAILKRNEGRRVELIYDKTKYMIGRSVGDGLGILGDVFLGDSKANDTVKEFYREFTKRAVELRQLLSSGVTERSLKRIPDFDERDMEIVRIMDATFKDEDDKSSSVDILQTRPIWGVLERFEDTVSNVSVEPITDGELDVLNAKLEEYLEALEDSEFNNTEDGKVIIAKATTSLSKGLRQLTAYMRTHMSLQASITKVTWSMRSILYTARREMIGLIELLKDGIEDEDKKTQVAKLIDKFKSEVVSEHDNMQQLKREFKAS